MDKLPTNPCTSPSPKIKNFRFGWTWKDDWPPNPHWKFKYQIWPGHGNMTNLSLTLTQNLKFQIWPGYGKMTWLPLTLTENLNIRFGLDMDRWLTPHPHQKFRHFFKISDLAPFFHHIFFEWVLHKRPFTREGNFLVGLRQAFAKSSMWFPQVWRTCCSKQYGCHEYYS